MNIIETSWIWNGGLSKRSETKYIALHHAAAKTCSVKDIDNWHKGNGWSGIGYHFFVRKDGTIYRGRPIWSIGAHVSGKNNCSIGICAEGNFDVETTMTIEQKTSITELIGSVKKLYPNAEIVGHREIGASDCPGKYYPLDYFKNYESSEELKMTQYEELLKLIKDKDDIINLMGKEIESLKKANNKMIYNYIDENMPEWARDSVRWCVDNGIIEGDETGLGLDDRDLRWCVVIKRLADKVTK